MVTTRAAGTSADSIEPGLESYNHAEDVILEDMPSIPIFDMPSIPIFVGDLSGGYSELLANVSVDCSATST